METRNSILLQEICSELMEKEKVVLRFIDGRIIRGYIVSFSSTSDMVIAEDEQEKQHKVNIHELKAIFFVRTFEGDRYYNERKLFNGPIPAGKRVFVRFKDSESMMGYIEGDLPWKRGFFLESNRGKGFFLIPVDRGSNNIKVFVITSSVLDVTVMG